MRRRPARGAVCRCGPSRTASGSVAPLPSRSLVRVLFRLSAFRGLGASRSHTHGRIPDRGGHPVPSAPSTRLPCRRLVTPGRFLRSRPRCHRGGPAPGRAGRPCSAGSLPSPVPACRRALGFQTQTAGAPLCAGLAPGATVARRSRQPDDLCLSPPQGSSLSARCATTRRPRSHSCCGTWSSTPPSR